MPKKLPSLEINSELEVCEVCGTMKHTKAALVGGKYYRHICGRCLNSGNDDISSNAAGYERRRGYEDNAQDTVQPYTATGPNPEFYRLYPLQAEKMFSPEEVADIRRNI